ncbi:flavin reductase family protein [Aspergillus homomorphus CBS 101889]|uniref:Flavin reductase like domain-containing protein n=1 Tax=Aspergillus homomorphus (strain CBS 101889) TaxID=1450537 RepID=A0A395HTQ4_ASPHC|nr:hypothetical protein BO97DRAFT_471899 [Aspergillus homomorphus CBS 101889]RAL10208.1 hypothetical protein BO97DRAFT_471899 [Aspergillus homomorphus CBS 101889]
MPSIRPRIPVRMSSSAAATATATAPAASSEEAASKAAKANYKIVMHPPYPGWEYGQGVPDNGASARKQHREIDPYASDRLALNDYRVLVSGIALRPVGFLSTVSADRRTKNLSPFSYFQVVDHDPPMFIVGFSSRPGRVKDTYQNLKETGECAVNATSTDAPYGVSQWEISGLHEAPATSKVLEVKEFAAHFPRMSESAVVLVKATRFWVEEGTSNADFSHIDLEKLRPVSQLGGRPRTKWENDAPEEASC